MPIDVRLLGALEITGIPAPASDVYRTKRIAALSYLLIEDRPVPRLDLAAMLWPESDLKRARGSLNELLLQLRRAFGADSIVGRADDQLVLDRSIFSCDAVELDAAAKSGRHADVIHLYAGDLLPSFVLPEGSAFNDWLEKRRAQIRLTVSDSAWQLASKCTDPRRALGHLELCARLRPYDEAILRRRLELINATQGTTAALALSEQTRQDFREQLGATLSSETKALINAMCAAPSTPEPEPSALPVADKAGDPLSPSAEAVTGWPRRPKTAPMTWLHAVIACSLMGVLGLAGFNLFRPVLASGSTADIGILPIMSADAEWNAQVAARMATLLGRERSVAVGEATGAINRVRTTLRADGDVISGTVEVLAPDGVVKAAMPIMVSRRFGPDTVAAVAARFVLKQTEPVLTATERELAVARGHVERALGDFTRGAKEDIDAELRQADSILTGIPRYRRNDDWSLLRARLLYLKGTNYLSQDHNSLATVYFGEAFQLARSVDGPEARAIALRYRDLQSHSNRRNAALADSFRTELSEALAQFPRNGSLWAQLSKVRFTDADYTGAVAAAEKARELDPALRRDLELSLSVFRAALNGNNDVAALAECDRIRILLRDEWPADACSIFANGWAGGAYDLAPIGRRLAELPARAREGNIDDRLRLLYVAALAKEGDRATALKVLELTPSNTTDSELATYHLIALYSLGRTREAEAWRSHILSLPEGTLSLQAMARALPQAALPR